MVGRRVNADQAAGIIVPQPELKITSCVTDPTALIILGALAPGE